MVFLRQEWPRPCRASSIHPGRAARPFSLCAGQTKPEAIHVCWSRSRKSRITTTLTQNRMFSTYHRLCQFGLLPQSSNAIPSPQRGPNIKGSCDGNAEVSPILLLFIHQAGPNRQRTAALTQGPPHFRTQPRTAGDIPSPRVPLCDFAGQKLPLPQVSRMAHHLYPSSNLPCSDTISIGRPLHSE